MKKQLIISALSLISFEAMAQFAVTNNFTSGNVISASQMNTNFNEIEAEINTLWGAGSITSLQLANGAVTAAHLATMGATANQVLTYTGSTWTPMTPSSSDVTKLPLAGGTMTGSINMSAYAITNLMGPTSPNDAATKNYVDSQVMTLNATNITTGTLSPNRGGTGMPSITSNKFVITNSVATAMTELTCSPGQAVGYVGANPGCVDINWTSSANGIEFNSPGGNVAIGMGAVNTNKLHVLADGGGDNGIVLNAAAAGSGMLLGLHDQGTARFIVQQSGMVGIGTGTPSTLLDVVNDYNGVQPTVTLKNNYGSPTPGVGAALKFQIGATTAKAHIEGRYETTPSPNSSSLSFHTSNSGTMAQKMLITPEGTVGIATNTPNPLYKLVVNGIIAPASDTMYKLGDVSYRFLDVYSMNASNNTSDRREKKDIQESDLGLEFINKLQPVSYRWKKSIDSDVHYGLIAQDVEKTLKESVKNKHQASITTYDKKSDKYGMRYTELISPIIKAIKELDAKITMQKVQSRLPASVAMEKMQALESENKAMKAYLCSKDPSAPFCKR